MAVSSVLVVLTGREDPATEEVSPGTTTPATMPAPVIADGAPPDLVTKLGTLA